MGTPTLMITSNRTYDALKTFAMLVLPGLGTLYFALSEIWGLPYGTEVVGTIVALDAFLGVALGISTSNYEKSGAKYDGTIEVFEDDESKRFVLNYDEDPYELENKDQVVFKVTGSQ